MGTGDSPVNKARLYKQLGLNKPILLQYFYWMKNIIHGNLGTSFISETSVWGTIRGAVPIDLEMMFISQVLAFATAIPAAMRSAKKPDGVLDRIPWRHQFHPVVNSLLHRHRAVGALRCRGPGRAAHWCFLLRVVVAGLDWQSREFGVAVDCARGREFVIYYRVLRSDLIATLQEEFITMARSKGISQRRIMWRHAFRPSSVALLGAAGVNIGGLLAGGFIVQYLLDIPGLGYTLIQAIGLSDYLVVQGIVLVVSVGVILINFFFDFLIKYCRPED